MHENQAVRILIVDDHSIVRHGLALLINQQKGMIVCSEAEDAETAQSLIDLHQPDLIILDISLRDISGLELLEQIKSRQPDLLVLVVSMHTEPFHVERALRAGANGYFTKQERAEKLLCAIQTVLDGEIYLDESLQQQMLKSYFGRTPKGNNPPFERLTNRQFEIMQLLGKGFDTRRIAAQLHISVKTVEAHRANIKEKLALNNTTELLQYAFRLVANQTN